MRPAEHSMYFLALLCPARVNEKVAEYKKWMKDQFGCVVALRSPAHITLIPPFWLDHQREPALLGISGSLKTDKELIIEMEGFSHFGKKVLFINVNKNEELAKLRSTTEEYFIKDFKDVIKKEERPFHPHVTIANRDMLPHHFLKAWEHFSKKEFREQFMIDKLSVLKMVEGKWELL